MLLLGSSSRFPGGFFRRRSLVKGGGAPAVVRGALLCFSHARRPHSSSVEAATRRALGRIDRLDPSLNAFVAVETEGALEAARRLDAAPGEAGRTALWGVAVAVKDNLEWRLRPPTAASGALANGRRQGASSQLSAAPPRSATAVARLEAAGCVVVGVTNCDEFGMGSTGESSYYGATKNPWDVLKAPGGSSSGAAAAVASGCVPLALGSDTGGSIRQPAAWTGVVGLKPTYGRVSRDGLLAYCSSTDTVGPLARTVDEAAAALSVLAGLDPCDATTVDGAFDASRRKKGGPPTTLRVALLDQTPFADAETADAVTAAARALAEACGQEVRVTRLSSLHDATVAYYVLAAAEAFTNLARYHDKRESAEAYYRTPGLFGPEVQRRLALGAMILGERHGDELYAKALQVRASLRAELEALFRDTADVLLSPTAPTTARDLGAQPPTWPDAAQDSDFVRQVVPTLPSAYRDDEFTCFASLAGLPALSVPCALSSAGLPIGLQLCARPMNEAAILDLGRVHETLAADWRRGRSPEVFLPA